MAAQQAEGRPLDFQPLVDYLRRTGGFKQLVETIGVKDAVQSVGVKEVVDAVGVKPVVEAIGIKQVWEHLSPQERAELLRLAQADQPSPPEPGPGQSP